MEGEAGTDVRGETENSQMRVMEEDWAEMYNWDYMDRDVVEAMEDMKDWDVVEEGEDVKDRDVVEDGEDM